jgi:DNA-binding response OmpR family regulator
MARVLVVEDEVVMAQAVAAGLRRCGHVVDIATDGEDALEKTDLLGYDLVLLDRDLPGIHGDEVCRELTTRGHPARILMLTAARSVDERVDGLRLGADDYLTKPFAFEELLARVEALSRRAAPRVEDQLVLGDLVIDRVRRGVVRNGSPIALTAKEYGVLCELTAHHGAFVSAEQLLDQVWDENADPFTNAVRVTMVGLRKKLGEPAMITTVRGVGYRFDAADDERRPVR